jgi:hypothetical protein
MKVGKTLQELAIEIDRQNKVKKDYVADTLFSSGIGPVCRAKGIIKENSKQGELFMVEAIPDFGDVICSRDMNETSSNVPHRIVRHSPDGFEWGYGGSGPSEFALNILSVFIGQREAERHYQSFKWDFICDLPREGGTIKRDDILKWVEKKRKEAGG